MPDVREACPRRRAFRSSRLIDTLHLVHIVPITKLPLAIAIAGSRFLSLAFVGILGDLKLDPSRTIGALARAPRGPQPATQSAALHDAVKPRNIDFAVHLTRARQGSSSSSSNRLRIVRTFVSAISARTSTATATTPSTALRDVKLDRRLRKQAQVLEIAQVVAPQAAERDVDVVGLGVRVLGPVGQGGAADAAEGAARVRLEGVLVDAADLRGGLVGVVREGRRVVPGQWDADVRGEGACLGETWMGDGRVC